MPVWAGDCTILPTDLSVLVNKEPSYSARRHRSAQKDVLTGLYSMWEWLRFPGHYGPWGFEEMQSNIVITQFNVRIILGNASSHWLRPRPEWSPQCITWYRIEHLNDSKRYSKSSPHRPATVPLWVMRVVCPLLCFVAGIILTISFRNS